MNEKPHSSYDPMSESSMDDDYMPRWYSLDEDGEIVPSAATQQDKADPEAKSQEYSDDTRVNDKLVKLQREYYQERRGLSDYGHQLLG